MIWGMIQNTKNNETNNWEDSLENAINNLNYIDASHHPMVTAERLENALKSIAQAYVDVTTSEDLHSFNNANECKEYLADTMKRDV